MKETLKNIFEKRKYEFMGIALIVLALLNTISLLSKDTGFVGEAFSKGMRLIVGGGIYGVPVLLIIFGIGMIYKSKFKVNMSSRMVGFIILLSVGLISLHLPVEHPDEFVFAFSGQGGGIIGGLFLYILRKFFADGGTYVILSALTLVSLL
ncbi:DNA translocase FtsK 4TM domain-containing protein, partial [Halonatronum saccharophilum]